MQLSDIFDIVKEAVTNNQFFQGGAVLSVLAAIGYQLKSVPVVIYKYFKRFIIKEGLINQQLDGALYEEFNKWYNSKYPENFRKVEYYMPYKSDSDKGRYDIIKYQDEDFNWVWKYRRLIKIQKNKIKLENANNISNLFYHEYRLSGMFAGTAINRIIDDIKDIKNRELSEKVAIKLITHGDAYTRYNTQDIEVFKKFDQLYFQNKDVLLNYINKYKKRSSFYLKHGIKFKTGIRLSGPAGTGKSSIILAMAYEFNMNVCLVNLASFNNDTDFINYISDLPKNTIISFEDIDDFLSDSIRGGNTRVKINVSFSTILQVLDGMISPENVIFVLTTNKPTVLDSALYRHGRINLDLKIDYPTLADLSNYLHNFYPDILYIDDIITKANFNQLAIPMATVEMICMKYDDVQESIEEIKKVNNGNNLD